MSDITANTAEFEKPEDAGDGKAGYVKLWLSAIDLASREEKDWREHEAPHVVKVYRSGEKNYKDAKTAKNIDFNILYSNVETICPAIYNSTPIPDVRTRFSKDDRVAKEAGDFIERALSYDLDVDEFDPNMDNAVQDNELVGRGVTRVRYVPYISGDQETGEKIAWEEAPTEHVHWASFRRGPGRVWQDVSWIAFELFLTREQLIKLSPELGGKVNLDFAIAEDDREKDSPPPEVFKRARVWEIWDKDKKQVCFIAPSYKDAPLREEQDPLGLTGFFPIPRPLMAIKTSDTLVPASPYRMYQDQAEELSRITRRITALIQMLKVRGVRDGQIAEFDDIADAEDGDLVAMQDATALYAQAGGLEKAIWLMPIDTIQTVLAGLYIQRDQIKQVIYEITGISDILRGESDPNETLGAQNIKAQFGSQRIQKKQKEAARYARDLLRIKAELIANKFQPQTLLMMTGIKLPSAQDKQMVQAKMQQEQAKAQQTGQPPNIPPEAQELLDKPTFDEVLQLLRSDVQRQYRIDVESDSTIRADLARSQENMTLFLQGTAQYLAAAGPAKASGIVPGEVLVEIFTAFARNFKLGKSAEDALNTLSDRAKAQEGKPDPAQQAQQQAMESEQQQRDFEMAKMQKDAELKQQAADQALQQKEREHELKLEEMQMSLDLKREEMNLKREEMEMKREEMAMKERSAVLDSQLKERTAMVTANAKEHAANVSMQTADHKAALAKQSKEKAPA